MKIWILHTGTRNKKVFNSEAQFLSYISSIRNRRHHKYSVYEEIESGKIDDYYNNHVKQNERDVQLRSVLGEIDFVEESIIKLKELYKNEQKPKNQFWINLISMV